MSSGLLSPPPEEVSLLDELVEKLAQDGRQSEARRSVAPLIDRLERSVAETQPTLAMPRRELMFALVAMIKELVEDEQAADATASPGVVRERVVDLMARIVQDLAEADCVLVRRLHTDGRAELTGQPYFHGDPVGYPPRVKTMSDGLSSRALFFRPDHKPTVVPDIEAPDANPDLRAAHRINLCNFEEDSPEHRFISAIRAEICIPLVVKGTALAGVVAVRWEPYPRERVQQIETTFRYWQKILTYFYTYALPIEEHHRIRSRTLAITRSLPQVVASITDEEFLRKVAVLLTSDPGLSWHRAFVYLFKAAYPADAVCLMAIGGSGDPAWANEQSKILAQYPEMADYLAAAESSAFGASDPLYMLAREDRDSLTIPADHIARHGALDRVFSGAPDPKLGFPRGDELVVLSGRDPWVTALPVADLAFGRAAARCEHYILPLAKLWPFEPLGFLVLDCPYPRAIECGPDLALTQLTGQLVASLLADRGLGVGGWYDEYSKRLDDLRAAGEIMARFLNDPQIGRKYEQKARTYATRRPYAGQG